MMRLLSLFLILALYCSPSFSKEVKITLDKKGNALSFDLENNWKEDGKLPGVDYLFVYPHDQIRDLISVLVSPKMTTHFTASKKEEQEKYEKMKREWAKKRGITIKHFYPLATNFKDKMSRYQFGLQYSVGGKNIIEFSHYYFCHQQMVNIKLLGDSSKKFVEAASSAIRRSIKCE